MRASGAASVQSAGLRDARDDSSALKRGMRRSGMRSTVYRRAVATRAASSASMSFDDDEELGSREIGSARRDASASTSAASSEPLTYENAVLNRKGGSPANDAGTLALGKGGSTMKMLGSAEEGAATGSAPLRINQDLKLWRAREMRNKAAHARSKEERLAMRLEAISMFEKAMEYDPTDGRAYCGIGQILTQMRRLDEARKVYQDGCDATGGDNAYIWQAFAVLEEKAGNIAKARKYYDAATAADKTHAAAWHGWGTLEKNQGNYQRARELYLKGVRLVPLQDASAHLYHSLGVMAFERGRTTEAREHFKQGVRTAAGAQSAAIWQSWGILEAQVGDEEQARKLFQKGLVVCPKSKYIWLAWGVWEAKLGYIERARELLSKGCKLNPMDTYLLQALAKLEAESGNIGLARKLFEQGTVLDSRHQPNWNAWALAEWRAGEIDRARNLFQRGVWVDPKKKDAAKLFHAWGVLEEREGNISLARQLYKCAVKVDPGSERIWLTWAAMEDKQGDEMRAIEIRNMCAQQLAEVSVGNTDLSPVAAFGNMGGMLKQLASVLGLDAPADSADDEEEVEAFDQKELTNAELMYGEFAIKDE